MDTSITVWFDQDSRGLGDLEWIVDLIDDQGNSITIAAFESEDEALRFGKDYAKRRKLPFVEAE
jgi:hypothetical protein